ncbi:hypothetical protein BGZ60DRAFT_437377 [Tricladium varicosporioides]|nr:hypothetical protein BGZ60DRAFT_437377 [Hymenoscyphus varicosporioides]
MTIPSYSPEPKPEYKPTPEYKPDPYSNSYDTTTTSSEYKPHYTPSTTTSDPDSTLYYVSSTSSADDVYSYTTETPSPDPYEPTTTTTKEYTPTGYQPETLSTKINITYYMPTPKPMYPYQPGYKSSNPDAAAFESNSEVAHGYDRHGLEVGAAIYWLLVLCGIMIGALIITGVGLKVGRKCKEGRREKRERKARFTERPAEIETSDVSKLV